MQNAEYRTGVINAIAAYLMWGFAPLYFKVVAAVPPVEILMHRIIWSLAFLLILVILLRKQSGLWELIRQPHKIKILLFTGLILGVNWLIFIYAINSNQLLEASLGYFINPLFNVLVGFLVLGERFRFWQKIAIAMATIGVINQLVVIGTLPIIALSLAATFCLYGLLRKQIAVDSFTGLSVETAMLMPLALIYWIFFASSDYVNMFDNSTYYNVWLLMAGVITTVPLICFNAAATRISFSLLGIFQYIGPSLMFLMAVFWFGEPLHPGRILTFLLIWLALVLYSWDSVRYSRIQKRVG